MQVRLDDEVLEGCPASVAGALEAGRAAAEARGRLVIEVHADGRPLDPALLENPPEDGAGIERLTLVSTAPGPFIRTTLLDAAELVGSIRSDQSEAVGLFDRGQIEEGFEPLQRALVSWAILRDVVDKSARLGLIDPQGVLVEGGSGGKRTGAEYIAALAEHLGEVKRALELGDFTALSDVLEGELASDAEGWGRFLRGMAGSGEGAA